MQELRFVLIVVGALAIAALLFHGLWTSKKEGKSKFGDKPLGKLETDGDDISDRSAERGFAPEDDFEIIRKDRKEPDFETDALADDPLIADPLISDPLTDYGSNEESELETREVINTEIDEIPSMSALDISEIEIEPIAKPMTGEVKAKDIVEPSTQEEPAEKAEESEPKEPELEVIVMNVHSAGDEPFIGTKLFSSMQQNDLLYGEMDIFHRHTDLSGTGKVLFSVANMMQPGTLKHDDPADFSTKGISFFMTLPCYGDADQNFKLMLKTAQQIADDLGGRVLDDARNLMTPNRIDGYKAQIKEFKAKQTN
ncbi:cell division protein ZipA [Vibrio sp. 404]|uniref:Cell division protein ZipA n=1 Tax=Vibrio marinisediminis TaxID=2758441 RepID=A0A7W2FSG2_9VIBR|nr:cell division protein ZipA [Vibrio marinisediminis]MBA5763421.1 cell division protein ZipA [Vibrio marinisediminis]